MRQVRGQEGHWYLIINQPFFSIYPRNSGPHILSLILMRQVRGQEVHWYLILNQFLFEIYNILVLRIWNIRGQKDMRSILEDSQ